LILPSSRSKTGLWRGSRITSVPIGFHIIAHALGRLSFFAVGVAGVIGEAGKSSGASTTAGSLGATEDLESTNSPVASSIDARLPSPGDFGDENQPPGNNRDDVEDPFRPRGETFETVGGSIDVSRSNFGLSFPCEQKSDTTYAEIGLPLWSVIQGLGHFGEVK